jgi:hypothetical protein
MMSLRYLVACAAAGVMVGRLFGVFARARFHYPPRIDEAPYWQQALLNALQVVEWPGLFGLTLATALVLWRWLGPRATGRARSSTPLALLAGAFGVVGALIVVPLTNRPGGAVAGGIAALMGVLVAVLLMAFWRAASGASRSVLSRWLSQLPLAAGHLVATSAAGLSLGYRGESAMIHGLALIIGIGLFVAEGLLAGVVAAVAKRSGERLDGGGSDSAVVV